MIAVSALYPSAIEDRFSVVLVHGAANSASVWRFWQQELAAFGCATYAIDLRGHGLSDLKDLSRTTMDDYADDVIKVIGRLPRPPVVMGWSMGGLVAMMVAAVGRAQACIALAPSLPVERRDDSILLRLGEFGPEEYGITSRSPASQDEMPDLDWEERMVALASLGRESQLARDERRRGIVIPPMPCPLLIVTGSFDTRWPEDRYRDLWLASDRLVMDGASHWGLVLNRRAVRLTTPQIENWLERVLGHSHWNTSREP